MKEKEKDERLQHTAPSGAPGAPRAASIQQTQQA